MAVRRVLSAVVTIVLILTTEGEKSPARRARGCDTAFAGIVPRFVLTAASSGLASNSSAATWTPAKTVYAGWRARDNTGA